MMITVKDELLQRDLELFFKARADLTAGVTDLAPAALADALIAFVKAVRASGESVGDERFKALLAEYAATLRQQRQASETMDAPRSNGVNVRAGVRAGLIADLEESAVGDQTPGKVRDLARQLDRALVKAYEVPGE